MYTKHESLNIQSTEITKTIDALFRSSTGGWLDLIFTYLRVLLGFMWDLMLA